ncbi:inositol monophosphatase family protein [Streptomyces sp. NPDC048309]|uniref:inositol monophosphatase family protein n=1 Tax=Streptomyces sp. NPDC048309 TaxID=3154618 RepID=UPI0033E099EB
MKRYLFALADHLAHTIDRTRAGSPQRFQKGYAPGGDPQFDIDHAAEEAVQRFVRETGLPMAISTEGAGLVQFGTRPEYVLIIDPVDGTRPAAAGFETATISIAAAPLTGDPTISDVDHALLREIGTGAQLYWDSDERHVQAFGYTRAVPSLSDTTELNRMFWSVEFNGHPAELMVRTYGHVIDKSANTGGLFVFNSATYSISRIITGQLDAYVDVGNRLLRDHPKLESEFLRVGHGHILHLFPYDIAAAVILAERAGVVVTDGYGEPLGRTRLLDMDPANQQSCIAASNRLLHTRLLEVMRW